MSKVKSVTVPLEFPLEEVAGKKLDTPITSLTFRRMKAGDATVAEGEGDKVKAGYRVFAALAGVDVEVIEELDMDDFQTVSEKVGPLMGKSVAKEMAKAAEDAGAI